mgnify:CR=1 FL=1
MLSAATTPTTTVGLAPQSRGRRTCDSGGRLDSAPHRRGEVGSLVVFERRKVCVRGGGDAKTVRGKGAHPNTGWTDTLHISTHVIVSISKSAHRVPRGFDVFLGFVGDAGTTRTMATHTQHTHTHTSASKKKSTGART